MKEELTLDKLAERVHTHDRLLWVIIALQIGSLLGFRIFDSISLWKP